MSTSSIYANSADSPPTDHSTPASSPPAARYDNDAKMEDGISEAMRREEEAMRRKREKEEAERDVRMERERQKDLEAGSEEVDKKFKALDFLLSQSKVRYY
jgi:ATP-dependent DNA helicase